MFEKSLNEMTATVTVEDRESLLADQHGVTIEAGSLTLTWSQAKTLALKLDKAIAGGITYKTMENRLRALRNSLVWAFGPEAEEDIKNENA